MSERGPTTLPSEQATEGGMAPTDPAPDFEKKRARAAARRALFGLEAETADVIGRYRIERRIGAGGMGEVYRGVDEQLDRKVAVKLMLPNLDRVRGPERLRREARALARLSHPNVVQIYEVGEHEGQTFLAMEFIEGGTLTDWLQAEPRRWPQILGRFLAAGRGLAAAHDAGITHRDFKPDNVLMTPDGVPRVADFGLAYTGEPVASSPNTHDSMDSMPSGERLSTTGSVLGTVRYMPIEQLWGEEVDARADQFAFCVSLYEALWGAPPFVATNVFERLEALQDDELAVPPRGGMPRSVWRVIRRGLARKPDERWSDMESLMAALEAIPRRRRRLATAAVVVPTAGLLVVLGRASEDSAPPAVDPCAQVEHELDDRWDPARAEALGTAFEATGLPYADATATVVHEQLDDWAGRWMSQRLMLCEATANAQLPGDVLGLRGACLDQQREQLTATVDVLVDSDAGAVSRAREQLAALPDPRACSDDQRLLLGVQPPPSDLAASVAALRRTLARSQAERLAGHYEAAQRLAASVPDEAEALGYRPLLAEALTETGELAIVSDDFDHGVALLERAVDLAEASRHDELAARIWLDLASHQVDRQQDAQRDNNLLRRAHAARERLGPDAMSRSRLEFVRSQLAMHAGDPAGAETSLRRALTVLDDADPRQRDLVHHSYLEHLADIMTDAGDPEQALLLRRQALEAAERVLGPQHPKLAAPAFSLGQALQAAERTEQAVPYLERAATLWLGGTTTPDPALGVALLGLVQIELSRGDLPQAEHFARRAADLLARSLPADHRRQGDVSMTLGVIADQKGEFVTAFEAFERATEQYASSMGTDASAVANARINAGSALLFLDRYPEARTRFEAAVAGRPAAALVPVARLGLAAIALRQGNPAAAREHLDALPEPEALAPNERHAHEFLRRLAALRSGAGSRPASPALQAAFVDQPHGLGHKMTTLAEQTQVTSAERQRLKLPPPTP